MAISAIHFLHDRIVGDLLTHQNAADLTPPARLRRLLKSSVNIVNVVTRTYDVYSVFESIHYCKACGVTLTSQTILERCYWTHIETEGWDQNVTSEASVAPKRDTNNRTQSRGSAGKNPREILRCLVGPS